jgi:hypothetical protein
MRIARSLTAGVVGLAMAAALLVPAQGARAQGCVTTLPVSWYLKSPYAAAFRRTLVLHVKTDGPRITGLHASLSTFAGYVLGKGRLSAALTSAATIRVRLYYPMQAGRFTLYFWGYPNADPSCGPKHSSAVMKLESCAAGGLPVNLNAAGSASAGATSYGFDVESVGGVVLKHLSAQLRAPGGGVVGSAEIPVLFGRLFVSLPLRAALLAAQAYTLWVTGYGPGRPAACGSASVSRAVRVT